ncbi:NAD-dependent epimerase/dehydratase family protein [Phaeobacter sp. C3_T13_0]|uniref:NAD-dependent epimerase/dehydratase family protein n=1 Tax=Phaeobacter cretensis TaxID=3342641 RepID=UPI0039BC29E7
MPRNNPAKTRHICVAGVSGLAGAHIARTALALGWRVTGTLRDVNDTSKTVPLMAMPGAKDRLRLVSADTRQSDSILNALVDTDALVIACLPSIRSAPDGTPASKLDHSSGLKYCIDPARAACSTLIEAAYKSAVFDIVLVSSTASIEPEPEPATKDELLHYSDLDSQIRDGKFIAAQKTALETIAVQLSQEYDLRLTILLSGMIVGPGVLPCHADGHILKHLRDLSVDAKPWHDQIPAGSMSLVHPVDLAAFCLAALQNPEAEGRYLAVRKSWAWSDIYSEIANFVPAQALPTDVSKGTETTRPSQFNFARRDSLSSPQYGLAAMISGFYQWLDDHTYTETTKVDPDTAARTVDA